MRLLKRFNKSTNANVSIMFGLAAIPLIAAAGVALDFMQGSHLQSKLLLAADNAGLAAASSESSDIGVLTKIVEDYVKKNGAANGNHTPVVVSVVLQDDGSLKVNLKTKMNTSLMRVIGRNIMDIGATSIISRQFGDMDIALVLDNTGSMNGRKLKTLKSASKDLVKSLFDSKTNDSVVRIGVVPFSQYVNIGMKNRNASWAEIAADSKVRKKVYKRGRWRWTTVKSKWQGCVGSRNYPWNTKDERLSNKIPGVMQESGNSNYSCPKALTELTDNKGQVISAISQMKASGTTYIPGGLMWGWRVVSAVEPFPDTLNKTRKRQRAIVLMTDGTNTRSPSYPEHEYGNQATSDRLTAELCENVKASKENITVYTVAFEINDTKTQNLMRSCASSPSHFFDADNSAELTASFKKIAKSLAQLRIAE